MADIVNSKWLSTFKSKMAAKFRYCPGPFFNHIYLKRSCNGYGYTLILLLEVLFCEIMWLFFAWPIYPFKNAFFKKFFLEILT